MEERPKKLADEAKEEAREEDRMPGLASSRARNKTVMLTPELTGQVRALLGGEGAKKPHDPLADILPPPDGSGSARGSKPQGSWNSPIPSHERNPTSAGQAQGFTATTNVGYQTRPTKEPSSKIVGFLVSFDRKDVGEVFDIRVGRWLVSSRGTEHGDCIIIEDDTISPLHAILRATDEGKVQILDQLSEFGTAVKTIANKEEQEVTGSMVTVEHGDMVRLGKRYFTVCLVPFDDKAES